jgi:hypothetical protein
LGVEDLRLQHDVDDDTGHDALRFLVPGLRADSLAGGDVQP